MNRAELLARYAAGERNFRGANLIGANLTSADLTGTDLTDAKLTCADLTCTDLTDADLTRARYTIPQVLLARWGDVSPVLCTALMQLGAESIPDGEDLFRIWAAGGSCPYSGVHIGRVANFRESREHWHPGRAPRLWVIWELLAREKGVTI